jgi:hypothetical protein
MTALSDLKRNHIEAYRRFLATNPPHRGDTPVCQRTVYRKLVLLRTVFDYLAEAGAEDAPARRLILPDDSRR